MAPDRNSANKNYSYQYVALAYSVVLQSRQFNIFWSVKVLLSVLQVQCLLFTCTSCRIFFEYLLLLLEQLFSELLVLLLMYINVVVVCSCASTDRSHSGPV